MPELTAVHFGLLAVMLIVGAVLGWFFRSDRCAKEKIAVNAGWQKERESQQGEHDRLAEQNKSLMEQISQYQASQKDYSNRARELAEALKEAFAQRDQLQRQIKDIRGNLEVAIAQRDRFHNSLQSQHSGNQAAALKDKDDKIFRLSRELTSWQSRVPPLVERFQAKNHEVQELTEELEQARKEIARLEELTSFDQTRIEPMDAETLPGGGDASNEPVAMTAAHDTTAIRDEMRGEDDEPDPEETDDTDDVDETGNDAADDSDEPGERPFDEDDDPDDEDEPPVDDDNCEDENQRLEDGSDSEEDESSIDDDDDSGAGDEPSADDDSDAEEEIESPVDDSVEGGEPDEDAGVDDLKMIKGIGPSIEKTLNELGIHRFQQIADMSEFEIDRVAQQLRGFRSRIYREDWIGQARDLHYDKSNQRS